MITKLTHGGNTAYFFPMKHEVRIFRKNNDNVLIFSAKNREQAEKIFMGKIGVN